MRKIMGMSLRIEKSSSLSQNLSHHTPTIHVHPSHTHRGLGGFIEESSRDSVMRESCQSQCSRSSSFLISSNTRFTSRSPERGEGEGRRREGGGEKEEGGGEKEEGEGKRRRGREKGGGGDN